MGLGSQPPLPAEPGVMVLRTGDVWLSVPEREVLDMLDSDTSDHLDLLDSASNCPLEEPKDFGIQGSASSGPPTEPEVPDYMHVDKLNVRKRPEGVYYIPDQISESELEEFVQQIESTLGGLGRIVIVDRIARTIRFNQLPQKLMPGPAWDNEFITYNVPFPEKRATKLKDAWPEVESALHRESISCVLDLANGSMQASSTTALKDSCMVGKARNLLELLSTTPVPLHMALEIFQGDRQQETINIGFQNGGICSNYGIKKDDYLKRWECLFCSLKALSKVACCHIFLDENTFTAVTAVGSSVENLSLLKAVVEDCITKNVCLSTSIRRFETKVMHESMVELHAKHTHSLKWCGPLSNEDGMLEVCVLYATLHENRVSKLQDSLPLHQSFLRNYGISCTLDTNSFVLSTTRGTKEPDINDKAWQLFELLSTTHVPASMAVELLNGMQTCLIKIGKQEGGLCSLYGIKEEEYSQRWECIRHSLEILAEALVCNVFLNDNTVAAVGKGSVDMIKQLVQNCILNNVCPGTAAMNYYIISQGIGVDDPHKQHVEMENPVSAMSILPELSAFCTFFFGEQVTLLGKDLNSVQAHLKKQGFSGQLFYEADYSYMIVSKTTNNGDPDTSNKIWDFLKLLSTGVEPFKAIEALTGSWYYDFIPTGSGYGKFCSKAGITEEQFARVVWPRIELGLVEISPRLECQCFISPDVITVIGPTGVGVLREFVLQCFCLRIPTAISMQAKINGKTVCPIDPEVRAYFGFRPKLKA